MEDRERLAIYKWLDERPFLNLNAICREIKVNRANFVKSMAQNKPLKEDVAKRLKIVLAAYGYKETSDLARQIAAKGQQALATVLSRQNEALELGSNDEINAKIAEIRAEKIPPMRDTPLGRKSWKIEQEKKINELKNKLK